MTLTETTTLSGASAPVQHVNPLLTREDVVKLYLNALFEGYNAAQIGRVEDALSPIMKIAMRDERLDYLDISRIGSAFRYYIGEDEAMVEVEYHHYAKEDEEDEYDE